jgi:hypothetical protein
MARRTLALFDLVRDFLQTVQHSKFEFGELKASGFALLIVAGIVWTARDYLNRSRQQIPKQPGLDRPPSLPPARLARD